MNKQKKNDKDILCALMLAPLKVTPTALSKTKPGSQLIKVSNQKLSLLTQKVSLLHFDLD